ncbi:hypothetical protein HY933_01050 [Candidatus Falkowbacteria bacterium]|nr:hypothetical protein [Candidatus Falkowbacteria bacterium]
MSFETPPSTTPNPHRRSRWVRRLATPLAAATVFGLVGHKKFSTPGVPVVPEGSKVELPVDFDRLVNTASERIVSDFPALGGEGVDLDLANNRGAFLHTWTTVLDAYQDGCVYYGGKVNEDMFELHTADGDSFFITVDNFIVRPQLNHTAVHHTPSEAGSNVVPPVNSAGQWWEQESTKLTDEEITERAAVLAELAAVEDPDDMTSNIDLMESIKNSLTPERLAQVQVILNQTVPQEYMGRVLYRLNLLGPSPIYDENIMFEEFLKMQLESVSAEDTE